jgi:uncharacterized delta-60 repeat protein
LQRLRFRPLLERLEERALLNAGDFDPTFGSFGVGTAQFMAPADAKAQAAAVQSDGKLVVAGTSGLQDSNGLVFRELDLARYNLDGSLDSSFGIGGKVATHLTDMGSAAGFDVAGVAVRADGKILVAGSTNTISNDWDFGVVLYNADGTLDTAFGVNGVVITDLTVSTFTDDMPYALAVQTDGKFVLAGRSDQDSGSAFAMARYNADGTLDTNFGGGGVVITLLGGSFLDTNGIAIQSDGKIVVAGSTSNVFGNSAAFLARYNTDGSLDTTFGSNGIVLFAGWAPRRVVLQVNNKIVIAGTSNGNAAQLARYDADGTLDTTFGAGGVVISSFASNVTGLALDADGKILVGGTSGGAGDLAVARFNQLDGSLDSTFGSAGIATAGFPAGGQAFDLTLQGSDIVEVGASAAEFAVARYLPTGALDASFSNDGRTLTLFPALAISNPDEVLVQTDGRIVLTANVTVSLSDASAFGLARFNTNGTPDNTFGINGQVVSVFGVSMQASAAVLQADGKIVVAGQTNTSGHTDFALARYNTDGSLDAGFGAGGEVITSFGDSIFSTLLSVAVQSDGRIVVLGTAGSNHELVRYKIDGALDTSFGIGGIQTISSGDHLAVQGDDRIVVAANDAIARYNPNGSVDSTFGTGGVVTTGLSSGATGFLALQSDGKIDFAGAVLAGGSSQVALFRYSAAGALDTTFGSGGQLILPSMPGGPTPTGLGIDSAGDLVISVFTATAAPFGPPITSGLVFRITPTGTLDDTFGNAGLKNASSSFISGLALQPDRKILLTAGVGSNPAVERLLGTPPGVPTSTTAMSGGGQTALVNMAYSSPLVVTVTDATGIPVSGVTVTFAAPTSGASVVFSGGPTVVTDSSGHVSVAITANGIAGAITITATVAGVATPAVFSVTNITLALFVTSLYQTVLNRTPVQGEVAPWVTFLQSGGTRAQVAQGFWESPEHRGIQVDGFYQTYLHRPADPNGRAGWVAAMVGGMSEIQVIHAFLASAEYQSQHQSDAAFVDGLYANVLGRQETAAEQAGWIQFLQNGGTRDQAEQLVLTSFEGYQGMVDRDYTNLLGRPADPGSETGWTNLLLQGRITPDGVAETLLGSDEFFARSGLTSH